MGKIAGLSIGRSSEPPWCEQILKMSEVMLSNRWRQAGISKAGLKNSATKGFSSSSPRQSAITCLNQPKRYTLQSYQPDELATPGLSGQCAMFRRSSLQLV